MFEGIAKPMPEPPATVAVVIPLTSPCMFTSGPPELPGLIAASVCRKSSNGPWSSCRALALMMPAVTVACRPNGEPTASTQSRTWIRSESPRRAYLKVPFPSSSLRTARSVFLSTPTILALCFPPSSVTTSISVAFSTTWAFVSAIPVASTMTPEPRLRCGMRSGTSPKKRRKNSSPKYSSNGVRPWRPAPREKVLMLITAGLIAFAFAADSSAFEEERRALAVGREPHPLRHPVLRHHEARHLGRALEVVVCAGRDLAVDELLGDASAEQDRDSILQLAPGHQEALLRRQLVGHSERGDAARDDRHLVHGIGVGDRGGHQRVTHLVMGDDIALLFGEHSTLLFESGDDSIDRFFEVGHLDRVFLLARREQRRLVDDVGEIGARETRRARGNDAEVDARRQDHGAGVQSQDRLAAPEIGLVDDDLPVEAARAQERLVEHLGAVRRSHDDHALRGVEAVHLSQQLVEGLLALVVAPDEPGAARTRLADRVQLVDEDDARGLVLGLLEQITDARGTHTDEHLDELGAGQGEEGHVRFARNGSRQQGLARARRTHHQHALGNPAAEPLVLSRIFEEVDDLDELGLRFVDAGDVGERRFELLAIEDLVFGAAERECLCGPAADPPHQDHPDGDHDPERDDPAEEEVANEGRLDLPGELDLVPLELGDERRLIHAGDSGHREHTYFGVGREPLTKAVTRPARPGRERIGLRDTPDFPLGQRHLLDLVGAHEVEEPGHRDLDRAGGLEPGLQQQEDHRRDQPVGQRELDALVEPRLHRGAPSVMLASAQWCVKRAASFRLTHQALWPKSWR